MAFTDKLDNLIGIVAPIHSLKRTIARHRNERLQQYYKNYEAKRSFEAVNGGRTQHDFLNQHGDADTAIVDSLEALRDHTREVEYNNGYVKG